MQFFAKPVHVIGFGVPSGFHFCEHGKFMENASFHLVGSLVGKGDSENGTVFFMSFAGVQMVNAGLVLYSEQHFDILIGKGECFT